MDSNIVSLLRQTLEILDQAQVPEDLRVIAFEKIVDLLQADAAPPASVKAAATKAIDHREVRQLGDDPTELIASRLGLRRETIDVVYFIDGDALEIVVPHGKLDLKKSRGTEQIALLVAAGRQASGLDEDGWTSADPIRQQCEHFKKYDVSNFATTIRDMNDVFTVRGSGRDRKVRMTAPAWQRAANLVAELAG